MMSWDSLDFYSRSFIQAYIYLFSTDWIGSAICKSLKEVETLEIESRLKVSYKKYENKPTDILKPKKNLVNMSLAELKLTRSRILLDQEIN